MCKTIRFEIPNNGILQINEDVIREFKNYKQIEPDQTEAGGILLGRILKGTNYLIIDEITTPSSSDIRRKYYFKRNKHTHQKIIDKRWSDSGKTENYFGEWHTHAENDPTPSYTDENDWKRRIRKDKLILDYLLSVIVGRKCINIWLTNKQNKIIKLKKIHVGN